MMTKDEISSLFEQQFNQAPDVVAQAPGRINIIGEHTDYNDGFVLPAAIAQHTLVACSKRTDDKVVLYSVLFDETFEIELAQLAPQAQDAWTNYILGVADQFLKRDIALTGFNLIVDGNVPLGSGLSSSASVECATAVALNQMYNSQFEAIELVKIAQAAEHTFAEVKCGIMDQFASVFGKEEQVVRLDCRDLTYEYYPLELGDYALLLLNTNIKHSLASSAYNDRREACETAVKLIQQKYPEVNSLRDVTVDMLDEIIATQQPDIYPKVKYVVAEINRVLQASEALNKGDLETVGELMYATHQGLSENYQVSCPELDFLVDFVKADENVLGARVMGGGFGGCTINLVKKDYRDALIAKIKPAYEAQFDLELTPIKVRPSQGAGCLN